MDDVLGIVAERLVAYPTDPVALFAFVKLQATCRGVWLRYRADADTWRRLGAILPQWSLPEHMGLRRRWETNALCSLA